MRRTTSKLLLLFSIFIFAHSPAFGSSTTEACLEKALEKSQMSLNGARLVYQEDMRRCYHHPISDRFFQCESEARKFYETLKKGIKKTLEEDKKACL